MSTFETLERGLPVYRQALDLPRIRQLNSAFLAWLERGGPGTRPQRELVFFLLHEINEALDRHASLRSAHETFMQRHAAAPLSRERRRLILDLAARLDDRRRPRLGDQLALQRFFGADALADRVANRLGELDRRLALLLDRLGHAVDAQLEAAAPDEEAALAAWEAARLESRLRPLLVHEGDERVQQATFACLARAIRGLPERLRHSALDEATLRFVYRAALEPRLSVWTQTEAMDLLGELSRESFVTALRLHFERRNTADSLFVRARLVPLVPEHVPDVAERIELVHLAAEDPAPLVRRAVVDLLPHLPHLDACALLALLIEDPEPAVRSRALGQMPMLIDRAHASQFAELLEARTADGEALLVARVAFGTIPDLFAALPEGPGREAWAERLTAHCAERHSAAEATRVRRWAATAGEALWLLRDDARLALHEALADALENLPRGGRRRLPRALVADVDLVDLGRILSLLARDEHGFDVEFTARHLHVIRGHRFGTRAWRVLHELRFPATDKRQGFRHTVGRRFLGTLVAPSTVLCELARTRVPGEPLHIDDEDGWRPFLPLLDNLLGSLDRGRPVDPVTLVTAEGLTELRPPSGLVARLRARWHLASRFPKLAEARNWTPEDSARDPREYVTALRSLGFRIAFRPHDWQGAEGDERVRRFFPVQAGVAAPLLPEDLLRRASDYFYSLYENTLSHLALFLGAMGALFLGQHLAAGLRVRTARRSIALCIGGWGTRGKSGTERLKAALFNALGYGLVSKTTGCEAMFIFARPFGPAREMFLFRPYDKATIWEQANLLDLTRRLRGEVFLWECMALTPSFVEILQRQWMRDDYATVTNAYPDHEDIQGPAGVDIPEVIANFIPRHSTVITSEEYMLPILRSEARRVGSRMVEVGWREALELTPDVLDRFPYDEHPHNIALVLAMARELGIDEDVALKEMADRVIPDLGVLKTFPRAPVDGRVLEFVNGMSANERYGALGNWRRMGFDEVDPETDPDVWVVTVINNRADRVARSKVFASMLVADLAADRHLLIGTNLDGLRSYIHEAWEEEMGAFSLGEEARDPDQRTAATRRWLRRFRIPATAEALRARLSAMARGLGVEEPDDEDPLAQVRELDPARAGDFEAWSAELHAAHDEAAQLLARAAATDTDAKDFDRRLHDVLRRSFEARIDVIEDSTTAGEEVVRRVVRATPPGLLARVMGMQNIKGTGLDFAYRWLAWETAHTACSELRDPDARVAERGLRTLVGFPEFGVLSERTVRDALETARQRPVLQKEAARAQLATVEAALTASMERTQSDGTTTGGDAPRPWLAPLEQLLDSLDAVARRRRADRIYRDLAHERVSPERAALELQKLNKRQKGGWLGSRRD